MRGDPYGYDEEYVEGGTFIGTVLLMLIGGAIALAAFDAFNNVYLPQAGLPGLAPVETATETLGALFGAEYEPYGRYAHYAMGILGYPLAYVILARPLSRMIWLNVHWWVTGLVFGVVIWAFATFAIPFIVTRQPPVFEFTEASWISLAAHLVYGFVLAAVMRDGRYV